MTTVLETREAPVKKDHSRTDADDVKLAVKILCKLYRGIDSGVLRNGSRVMPESFLKLSDTSKLLVRYLVDDTRITRRPDTSGAEYIVRWDKQLPSFVVLTNY